MISTATITILDGDPATENFTASSSPIFIPGATISIEAGYDSNNQVIFTGIITGQTIRIDSLIGSALEVECRDEAVKMIVGRKCLTFPNQKTAILFLPSSERMDDCECYSYHNRVARTSTVYATDWDFILARAEANGMIITTINGTVTVAKPDANTTSVLTVGNGNGLMEFNANMNAITQLGSATASALGFYTAKDNNWTNK